MIAKNFFYEKTNQPMSEDKCTFFTKDIIEGIRWLPSAMNKQDYVILFKEHTAHVFTNGFGSFSLCDTGIAMAHLEICCVANGINGHWEKMNNVAEDITKNWRYVCSFVCS